MILSDNDITIRLLPLSQWIKKKKQETLLSERNLIAAYTAYEMTAEELMEAGIDEIALVTFHSVCGNMLAHIIDSKSGDLSGIEAAIVGCIPIAKPISCTLQTGDFVKLAFAPETAPAVARAGNHISGLEYLWIRVTAELEENGRYYGTVAMHPQCLPRDLIREGTVVKFHVSDVVKVDFKHNKEN